MKNEIDVEQLKAIITTRKHMVQNDMSQMKTQDEILYAKGAISAFDTTLAMIQTLENAENESEPLEEKTDESR